MIAQSTTQGDPKKRPMLQFTPEAEAMMGDVEVMGESPFLGNPISALKAVPGVIAGAKAAAARGLGISGARGGENINAAVEAGKAAALDVSELSKTVGDIMQFDRIETIPMAVRTLSRRLADAAKGDINVEEARRFYPSISRTSMDEWGKLTPAMQRRMGELRAVLDRSLKGAMDTVGKGEQYASGMKEYARSGKAAKTYEKTLKPAAKRTIGFLLKAGAGGSAAKAGWDFFGD